MTSPSDVMRLGRYMLFDRIASGGMASVHLGRLLGEVGFARIVAIKRLHPSYARAPEFVAMFTDEARLAARIRHPNVVPTLDVVAEDGELFLVMEYVHGESLARLWRAAARAGALVPPPIAVAIVTGALYGLHAAHEARSERGEPLGLVHRDVSPQNILVDVDGVPRVLDFGIAKATWRMQTTQEGQLKGKLSYMAPEQISGPDVDRRADLHAISVVLWEMLTGVRYIDTDDVLLITQRILEGSPAPPSSVTPGLPRALDAIVLRGLSRDRSVRFATAKEMAVALEAVIPPATAREVGEWVQAAAREMLASRAALIAGIENESFPYSGSDASIPLPQRAAPIPTATSEAPTALSGIGRKPPAPLPAPAGSEMPTVITSAARQPPAPISVPAGSEMPTVLTSAAPSWPTTGAGAAPPPSAALANAAPPLPAAASPARPKLLVAGAVAALVLLLGGGALALLGLLSPDGASPAATDAPAPTAPPAPSAPSAPTAPAAASAPLASAAPQLPAAPPESSAAPVATAVPASAAPASTPARSARPPATRPPASKKACDPPFFIAKDGTKKYKLECL